MTFALFAIGAAIVLAILLYAVNAVRDERDWIRQRRAEQKQREVERMEWVASFGAAKSLRCQAQRSHQKRRPHERAMVRARTELLRQDLEDANG